MLCVSPRCCAPFDETAWSTNQYGLKLCKELSTDSSSLHMEGKRVHLLCWIADFVPLLNYRGKVMSETSSGLRAIVTPKKKHRCHARLLPPVGHIYQAAKHGGGAGISTSFHLPHLDWESHMSRTHTCTHSYTYSDRLGGRPQPPLQWGAPHSALQDTTDYPQCSQSQNVNPQTSLLLYC